MASPPADSRFVAVFIDFENVYYFLKNHFHDPPDLNDHVLNILRGLREQLAGQGLDCLVMNAYADFERIPTAPQGNLYLMGVNTRNVLGTNHKNAADMLLCIEAMEVLYTRRDIGTFVLVAGDRDYIPLLQHLRRQARRVLVAGFRESVSGDLLQGLSSDGFLDARELLPAGEVELLEGRRHHHQHQQEESRRLRAHGTVGVPTAAALAAQAAAEAGSPDAEAGAAEAAGKTAAPATSAEAAGPEAAVPREAALARPIVPVAVRPALPARLPDEAAAFAPTRRLARDIERRALAFMLGEFHKLETKQQRRVSELWLGPFMRLLTDELPELPDYERRDLINRLREAGTIRIEKRDGEPHPFSVIVVNYSHPDVWELNPGTE